MIKEKSDNEQLALTIVKALLSKSKTETPRKDLGTIKELADDLGFKELSDAAKEILKIEHPKSVEEKEMDLLEIALRSLGINVRNKEVLYIITRIWDFSKEKGLGELTLHEPLKIKEEAQKLFSLNGYYENEKVIF